MRAAFGRSPCDSDEIGNAGARGDLLARPAPGSNVTAGGSEVACGLR